MIPLDLEAFRKLMERASWALLSESDQFDLYAKEEEKDGYHEAAAVRKSESELYASDALACRALATATPAQLLGIVGEVAQEMEEEMATGYSSDIPPITCGVVIDVPTGRYIVTPREGA